MGLWATADGPLDDPAGKACQCWGKHVWRWRTFFLHSEAHPECTTHLSEVKEGKIKCVKLSLQNKRVNSEWRRQIGWFSCVTYMYVCSLHLKKKITGNVVGQSVWRGSVQEIMLSCWRYARLHGQFPAPHSPSSVSCWNTWKEWANGYRRSLVSIIRWTKSWE